MRLMSAAIVVGALALQPAFAERQCAAPADQAAFEVQALRSHLMVLAMGCQDDDRYNAFIRKYQRDLVANEQSVSAWFKHRYGARGQAEHDKFITDLANAVSSGDTTLGGDLCPRNGAMFNEVMALRGPADLPAYAATKDLIPPTLDVCTGQQVATGKPAAGKTSPAKATPVKAAVKH